MTKEAVSETAPVTRQSASAAESLASRMAATSASAVAFSRTGDRTTGDFKDAVVLRTFGDVPVLDRSLSH